MSKQSVEITPVRLRLILTGVMLLLFTLGGVLFTFGYKQLKSHAAAAQEVTVQAETSRSSLQDIMQVKKFLANNSDVVNRASQLVSQSQLYLYQDQIINDLNRYASEAGIIITNISFNDTKVTSTAAPSGSAAAAPTATATPAGIKSMTANVSIKNPSQYSSILNFINYVEKSLFRMQIASVSMSKATDTNTPGQITSNAFEIEVYVR